MFRNKTSLILIRHFKEPISPRFSNFRRNFIEIEFHPILRILINLVEKVSQSLLKIFKTCPFVVYGFSSMFS